MKGAKGLAKFFLGASTVFPLISGSRSGSDTFPNDPPPPPSHHPYLRKGHWSIQGWAFFSPPAIWILTLDQFTNLFACFLRLMTTRLLHWEDKYTYAKGKSKEWEYTLQAVILSLHSDQKNLLHDGFSP